MADKKRPSIVVDRQGLSLDGQHVPLIAGAVHYWRHDPSVWEPALRSVQSLGFRLVDVYVPWSVHEIDKERFDFGHEDPRKDLAAFLAIVEAQGLYAIIRPGPHINAEMTLFGLPERIVWRRSCQARSPDGDPVFLPVPPLGFPVPSYASNAFLKQATRFFRVLGQLLKPLRYPDGPVVMLQVDNEGALYFRDAIYDQDYHPDAVAAYRRFLAKRHGSKASPSQVYGVGGSSFHALEPPRKLEAKTLEDLAWHLEWAELQEHLVTRFLRRAGKRLRQAGFGSIPTSHNIPIAENASVLGQGSVQHVVDMVGLDYYFLASPAARRAIARRTSELALRGEVHDRPAFACELGAGYPPFMPPMQLQDNAFTVMTALAYGLRGYNAYMAVDRDRWVGAPIDQHGNARPSAEFWKRLNEAIVSSNLPALRRKVPVRIVTPRTAIRLRRLLNAFGPATAAGFSVMGRPASAHCLDDDFGTGQPLASATERFVDAVEAALEAEQVPFAHVGDDDPTACVTDAAWVVVAAPAGSVDPTLLSMLEAFAADGGRVSFGPCAPSRGPSLREVPVPVFPYGVLTEEGLDEAISRTIEELGLRRLRVTPAQVHATVHEDDDGRARVVFLINAGEADLEASLSLPGQGTVTDACTLEELDWREGRLIATVHARTVRMIRL
jgi:beta-galactosidase